MNQQQELRARLDAHGHIGDAKRLAYLTRRAITAQDYEAAAAYLDQIEALEHPSSIGTGEEVFAGVDHTANSMYLWTGAAGGGGTWPISIPSGPDTPMLLTPNQLGNDLYDPNGMLQTADSYTSEQSGNVTWPAGTWIRLPVGLWAIALETRWDSNTSGSREIYSTVIDDRWADDVHPVWENYRISAFGTMSPGQSAATALASALNTTFGPMQQMVTFFAGVSEDMIAAPGSHDEAGAGWAWGFVARQDSGSTRTMQYARLTVVQLSSEVR